MANQFKCRQDIYKVSTTHPDIHTNICFSRLNVEKLIVVQVVNRFPVFCENHKRSPRVPV